MRGRVIILIGAIILLAVVAVVVVMMGGNGDDTTETPEANVPGDNQPIETNTNNDVNPPVNNDNQNNAQTTSVETRLVAVAAQDIQRGSIITFDQENEAASMVRMEPWPMSSLVEDDLWNYILDTPDLAVGAVARVDIPRGSPITVKALTTTYTELAAAAGSEASAVIPPGTVAVAIPLDPSGLGQVAYGIQDGDYVDVYFSFLFVNVDEEFQTRVPNTFSIITRLESGELSIGAPRQGRQETSTLSLDGVLVGPSETAQRPRLVTQQMVTGAYVVHVGYFPMGGHFIAPTPTQPDIVVPTPAPGEATPAQQASAPTAVITATPWQPIVMTVAVSPQDAVMLTWAIDAQIPINLALRPVNDANLAAAQSAVSLSYLMDATTAGHPVVQDPGTTTVALEPPITSIRRFDVASLYDFVQAEFNAAEGQPTQ
jgi:Flp pilus assembly protein CpaB